MSDDASTPSPNVLVPLHAVSIDSSTGTVLRVVRRPGRPRRARPAPDADERIYIETTNAAREEHVARDPLVRALGEGVAPERVIQETIRGIARESASIAFEVRRAMRDRGEVEQLLTRRCDGLCKIAGILLAQRRAGIEPEIPPEKLQMISQMWIDLVRETASTTLPPEIAQSFVARIERAMNEWLNRS